MGSTGKKKKINPAKVKNLKENGKEFRKHNKAKNYV